MASRAPVEACTRGVSVEADGGRRLYYYGHDLHSLGKGPTRREGGTRQSQGCYMHVYHLKMYTEHDLSGDQVFCYHHKQVQFGSLGEGEGGEGGTRE